MENIRKIFLTRTIPDMLCDIYSMPEIKFVFDDKTLNEFVNYLDKDDNDLYTKGLKSINYLAKNSKDAREGVDETYIYVTDSDRFFYLLKKLVEFYFEDYKHSINASYNFIRSIWLRMGSNDIVNVEKFLERQALFMKNYSVLPEYREIDTFDNKDVLAYRIKDNEDWFETNKNIVFSIRKYSDDLFDIPINYEFPAIHFGISKENGKPICYIYGIQSLNGFHNENIKDDLQPIRKKFRNKYVSADFIICLSLFLDFLYDIGIRIVEVPTLQVFNYSYHENLSSNINNSFGSYTDGDKKEIEELYENGDRSDRVEDYMHTKKMVSRFVDKQDSISYNKTERLIYTFLEIINNNDSIELVSEPYGQSDNMVINLYGKTNVLSDYNKKKRTI